MQSKPVVIGVGYQQDGLQIAYVVGPTDAKENGLIFNHSVFVPSGSDYDDELEAVGEALQALLEDVLEDEPELALFTPTTEPIDEDEDDE